MIVLEKEQNPQEKFQILNKLIPLFDRKYDRQLVISYYKLGIYFAEQTENFMELGKWSNELFEIYRLESGNEEEALVLMLKAKKHVDKINDTRIKGNVFLKLAAAYYDKTDFSEAIEQYSNAEQEFSENDSIFIADALFFRAQARDYKGELIGAMTDYQKARLYYENLHDSDYVEFVNNGMAVLYSKYNIFEEAEKIRLDLAKSYLQQDKTYEWAVTMYNQSRDYLKQNKLEEHSITLTKVFDKINNDPTIDPEIRAIIGLSLSNFFSQKEDFKMQNKYFLEAKSIIEEELQGSSFIKLPYLKSRVLILESQKEIDQASQLIREYREMAVSAANMDQIIDAYLIESRISEKRGDYKNAFMALSKYQNFKDSIFQSNQANTFSYYQTLYETEKKERDLLLKTQEISDINEKNRTKTRYIITISIFIMTIMLLWFLIKNLRDANKAKKLQEKFSQDLLLSQEIERKRISKDLHDGLGQSLLLIKNKVVLNRDTATSELLNHAIEELRGISRSLHPFQLEELGVTGAIQNLLDQIDSETDIFVSSELDDIDDLLDKDQQLHVYRIVQESFNNIIKHAQSSAVKVSMFKSNRKISLSIQDNGIGFDFSEKFNDFKSLGLKTLKERTATLGGTMKVESELNKGTTFTFLIFT
ncbi:ATP-binding protein [Belliella sp. R4-6]|uniref:histidine kinase n=1 Tax=Belliella alkalica TaxID=1730871 RepID=A0ABS9VA26_9BACT|nr:sensor histidine kinase [Belliella alkalica]MCH7413281.1 ATP-binding protein [Belliella alkalica]